MPRRCSTYVGPSLGLPTLGVRPPPPICTKEPLPLAFLGPTCCRKVVGHCRCLVPGQGKTWVRPGGTQKISKPGFLLPMHPLVSFPDCRNWGRGMVGAGRASTERRDLAEVQRSDMGRQPGHIPSISGGTVSGALALLPHSTSEMQGITGLSSQALSLWLLTQS